MFSLLKALVNGSNSSKKQSEAANTCSTDETGRRSSGDSSTASSNSRESAPHKPLPVLVRKACAQWKPGMPLTADPTRPRSVCLFKQEKFVYLDLDKDSSNNGEAFAFLQDVNVENELSKLIQQDNNIDWLKKALFSYTTPFCVEPDIPKRYELDETFKDLCSQRVTALIGLKNNYQMLYDFGILDRTILPPLELHLQLYEGDKYPSDSGNRKIETYFNSVCNVLKQKLPSSDPTLNILQESYQFYTKKLKAINDFLNRKETLLLRVKSFEQRLADTGTSNAIRNILLYMVHHLGWTDREVHIVFASTIDEEDLYTESSYYNEQSTLPPIYLLHEKGSRVFYFLNEKPSIMLTKKPSTREANNNINTSSPVQTTALGIS